MAQELDELLDHLEPERVLDVVSARADEALNSFLVRSGCIATWDEFRACLIRFIAHVEYEAFQLDSRYSTDPDFAWGRCVRILMNAFGADGEKAGFELARTGNEGGLYAVLKAVANSIAEQVAKNEISVRVLDYLNHLTAQQRLATSADYLERYGHLLPAELTEGSAARLHDHFHKVLAEHPYLMRRLREIGRR